MVHDMGFETKKAHFVLQQASNLSNISAENRNGYEEHWIVCTYSLRHAQCVSVNQGEAAMVTNIEV